MKTHAGLLLSLVAVFSAAPLSAQTEKGRIISDVNFELDNGTTTLDATGLEIEHSNLAAKLFVGYTVIDNLELGGFLGLSHNNMEIGSASEQSQKSTVYGLAGRYYFLDGTGMRPYVGLAAGLGTLNTAATGASDTKHGLTFYSGAAGVAYFVNPHVGLQFQGEYVRTSFAQDDASALSDDMSAKALQFSIGTIVSF